MKQYWISFIDEYNDKIFSKSLLEILESFWFYCNNRTEKCEELMNK